ncbi:MAG TPA: MerR family transcriptional regulator [Phycisphaerales bacterium]|nr:MerR family transcriptional regulator [Phycisphaerales bacterium]
MFTIGELSKITGLSVKALRFYHEKQVLIPPYIDEKTGYRYYDHSSIEKAYIITYFRKMEFPVSEIKEILDNYDDQADILDYLQRHKQLIEDKMRKYRNIAISLDNIISNEKEAIQTMQNSKFEVEEKTLQPMLIAGVRMKGKYSDCGKGFSQIARSLGRSICGKPFCLHYDGEYREDDANFEACMPVRKSKQVDGISVRQLPGGRCISLLHKGPYEQLGRSYEKILGYAKQKGLEPDLPSREIYLKGPGMILKGNPRKYLTEIQILIRD